MDRNRSPPAGILNGIYVALRKESVDRNAETISGGFFVIGSLSARRAWIEIIHRGPHHFYLGRGRSPQGERG